MLTTFVFDIMYCMLLNNLLQSIPPLQIYFIITELGEFHIILTDMNKARQTKAASCNHVLPSMTPILMDVLYLFSISHCFVFSLFAIHVQL